MNKRFFKMIGLTALIIFSVVFMASCGPKYETITQNPGKYRYSIGEKAKITEIESGDEIAQLKITSCKLVEDEPFIVVKKESSDDDDDDFEEYKYTAIYEIKYEFNDEKGHVNYVSDHFRSRDKNFDINPMEADEKTGVLYVAAKKGNNGDDTITLGFSYDTFQIRDTATFDIKVDKVAKEKSFEDCEVLIVDERGSKKSADGSDDGPFGVLAVLGIVLGLAGGILVLSVPVLGIIGFANSVSNSKKLKFAYEKIRQLEYALNNRSDVPPENKTDEDEISKKG